MATIRKRGTTWQVQVRRQGYPLLTKSFTTKSEAEVWGRQQEASIDTGDLSPNVRNLRSIRVFELLDRYERDITPNKRGAPQERCKLALLKRHRLASLSLDQLSGSAVSIYRDERLKQVTSGTVRRELAILAHCFHVAMREWDIPLRLNPVSQISLPKPSKARSRRLNEEDFLRFWNAVERARAPWVRPLVLLAIETGMRRGELLSIRWSDIDLVTGLAHLHETKNGYGRSVPLSPVAVRTLAALPKGAGRVFSVKLGTLRESWKRLLRRAGIDDYRFHDLRHEAVSRLFELGLTTPEVALISGHRDLRMVDRYTHLRPETVARRLASLSIADLEA